MNNDSAAWDTIFRYFNYMHGKGTVGYKKGEKIAIKLSLVESTNPNSNGGNINFTPPQTVLAQLRQLVYNAGVEPDDITFYDIMRDIPTSITVRCKNEFPKVHFVGEQSSTYQEKLARDTTVVHWSEPLTMEINGGHTAYLPTVITQASYLINLANLKGHRYVGFTGCSKNHFGSMCADGDVNTPHAIGLHCYVTVHDYNEPGSPEWSFKGRPMATYNPLVDLMGNKDIGGKTLLFMVDGLYSVPVENEPNSNALRWMQVPFNNHYSSSIFMSQDNVAIESVILDFLRTEQAINPNFTQEFDDGSGIHNVIFGNVDNYLHEAAEADNPPSGTVYKPNGVRLSSLGVHEHWNNGMDKQYSRNLGKNYGIELKEITPTLSTPVNLGLSKTISNSVLLTWSTAVTDSNKIIIYRSLGSSTDYQPLDTVIGSIASFEDTSAYHADTYFYRIKSFNDSTYSPFSNEVKATVTNVNDNNACFALNIYPNPVHQTLNLNLTNAITGNVTLHVSDMVGRIFRSEQLQKTSSTLIHSINIENLPKGMYFVELSMRNFKYDKVFEIQ